MPAMSRSFAMLQAVQYEMQQNPLIVCSRQNSVGSATRSDGKSIDLLAEFGLARALARGGQAIDEDWMTNSTIGCAIASQAPAIVTLPGMTTVYPFEFVFNTMAEWNHISGGQARCPVVLNLSDGGRSAGAGQQHSHVGEASLYANMAGLKVVVPHKVYDVKGLMHAAIRDGGPVVFFTSSGEASADIPDEPFVVPIGKAQILQEGTDITIASIPPATLEVEKALPELTKAGIKVEFFDPRTLKPFDEEALIKSVTKTKRLLVVSHGHYTNDFSSHMIAVAAQAVSGAKFYKITFPDAPSPGSGPMVQWMTPDAPKIIDAAKKLIG